MLRVHILQLAAVLIAAWIVPGSLGARVCALNIAVASNFAQPLKRLGQRYRDQTGCAIKLSTAASGKHYAQIIHHAPFDLFLAANASYPESLHRQGLGSRPFTYARGRIALWNRTQGVPLSAQWLRQQRGRGSYRMAWANPKTAPYGQAAARYMAGVEGQWQEPVLVANIIAGMMTKIAHATVKKRDTFK